MKLRNNKIYLEDHNFEVIHPCKWQKLLSAADIEGMDRFIILHGAEFVKNVASKSGIEMTEI